MTEWTPRDEIKSLKQAPLIDGRGIDQNIAETTPCPKCGGKCEYEADDSEGSYRAFAVCVDCGNRHEF